MKLKLEGLGFPTHPLRLIEGKEEEEKLSLQLQETSKSAGLVLSKGHCACACLGLLVFLVRIWWLCGLLYSVDFRVCALQHVFPVYMKLCPGRFSLNL